MPFVCQNAEPRGVAVAIFDDHVAFLNAFKLKAHAQCRLARAFVERITLPLDSAIAQFKTVFERKIGRFAVDGCAMNGWRVSDVAQLDLEIGGAVAH